MLKLTVNYLRVIGWKHVAEKENREMKAIGKVTNA